MNKIKQFEKYKVLLNDIRWKAKTIQIKNRDNNKCRSCGELKNLQVHHRQYHFVKLLNQFKKPWDYPSNTLITLCHSCHNIGHINYKIPTINI